MQVDISYRESIRENPKSHAPNQNQHCHDYSDCIIVQSQLPLSTGNTNDSDNECVVDLLELASGDDVNMLYQPGPKQKSSYSDIVQGNSQFQSSISSLAYITDRQR